MHEYGSWSPRPHARIALLEVVSVENNSIRDTGFGNQISRVCGGCGIFMGSLYGYNVYWWMLNTNIAQKR